MPLRPTPPPGTSSARFRQTFAGSGLACSLRSSRGARLRPPLQRYARRFQHGPPAAPCRFGVQPPQAPAEPLSCSLRPSGPACAGSRLFCLRPSRLRRLRRNDLRLNFDPAHPTGLPLCSAASRCAALRRGAPTSRFRVGRSCVSAPFRSAPRKPGPPCIRLRPYCLRSVVGLAGSISIASVTSSSQASHPFASLAGSESSVAPLLVLFPVKPASLGFAGIPRVAPQPPPLAALRSRRIGLPRSASNAVRSVRAGVPLPPQGEGQHRPASPHHRLKRREPQVMSNPSGRTPPTVKTSRSSLHLRPCGISLYPIMELYAKEAL